MPDFDVIQVIYSCETVYNREEQDNKKKRTELADDIVLILRDFENSYDIEKLVAVIKRICIYLEIEYPEDEEEIRPEVSL